jgi:FlaA1/EpsC-like NDP-sugar epimerase
MSATTQRSTRCLLGRDSLPTAESRLAQLPIRGRTALVSGAAGSVGSEICTQLLRGGVRALTLVDQAENALYLLARRLERDFPGADHHIEIADIRDSRRISRLLRLTAPQDVFHAAAFKQVPLMEAAPVEAVKNNIFGTDTLAAAADAAGADRFVYISTDKAVRPTSVMGATKRVGEEIVRDWAERSSTAFCAVRFGNVLGSSGSVVSVFEEQIAAGGPVTVTHPDARRFFMTVSEATSLVLEAAYDNLGELCVLDMGEPVRIVDLAKRMIHAAGLVPDRDIAIQFVGLRPGEKVHETLVGDGETSAARGGGRISVLDRRPVAPQLRALLGQLSAAASVDDEARVLQILRQLVPDYAPLRIDVTPGHRNTLPVLEEPA